MSWFDGEKVIFSLKITAHRTHDVNSGYVFRNEIYYHIIIISERWVCYMRSEQNPAPWKTVSVCRFTLSTCIEESQNVVWLTMAVVQMNNSACQQPSSFSPQYCCVATHFMTMLTSKCTITVVTCKTWKKTDFAQPKKKTVYWLKLMHTCLITLKCILWEHT